MRVVGGRFRGRQIYAPKGNDTRPTSDRVREALFNILDHGVEGFAWQHTRVLDLFAGTGALGIEALSRGASFCLFIEQNAAARAAIWRNTEAFELTGITKIFRRDATGLGPVGTTTPFGLVFLDPPYGRGFGETALRAASAGGWLEPGAIAIVEEGDDAEFTTPDGFAPLDRRVYGDTQVLFLRAGSQ